MTVAGPRIAVDVGSVRVGIAASDPDGRLASPVATVARDPRGDHDLDEIAELVAARSAQLVLVGLPVGLAGVEGLSAAGARAYARRLAVRIQPVPVRLVDERLSTVTATEQLRAGGVPGRRQRAVVDQAAAVVILQAALDAEHAQGTPPGEPVPADGDQ